MLTDFIFDSNNSLHQTIQKNIKPLLIVGVMAMLLSQFFEPHSGWRNIIYFSRIVIEIAIIFLAVKAYRQTQSDILHAREGMKIGLFSFLISHLIIFISYFLILQISSGGESITFFRHFLFSAKLNTKGIFILMLLPVFTGSLFGAFIGGISGMILRRNNRQTVQPSTSFNQLEDEYV